MRTSKPMKAIRTWNSAAAAAFLLLGAAGCGGSDGLNVLVVTLDTTRADHLHCYGRQQIETPTLDRLADQGILFENGIACAPLTLPSHSSIMTGLTPMAHGARVNDTQALGPGAVTLAELMKGQGYETAAFVGAFVVSSTFGLSQGFDVYDEDFSGGKQESDLQFSERPADAVTDAAIAWLDRRDRRKPFFAWVHYFDPHKNYTPPSPFREKYASFPYDGEIAFADQQLGRLLDELSKKGDWKHTLVWVVGDHGEALGEHGELSHSYTVYQPLIRVPYIVSHPESRGTSPSPRWKPRRVAEQVETIDIFPTVAELTGAAFQHPIEGHSLVPLLDGGRWEERPAYSESMVPLLVNGWAPPRSVHTRELQYIRAPRPELYDLVADAAELHNVAAQRPEDLARMQKELERLVARAEGARIESAQANLSEAERSMLASLGYLQSDAKPAPAQELDPKELELPDPKDYVRAASQYLMMGITSLMHQDPKEAERLFRKYLEVDRNSSEGRFYLGLAVRDQGRLEEALGIMREAQQRNPESFNATLHLGILNLILGHREEARPWLEKAIELNPYSGEPLFVLGTLMEDEGERAKALDLYDRALAIDKGNSTIHMRKGFLLLHMGRKQEGEAALHQAVELAPRTPQARQRLAARFQQEGRPDLAQPLLERP